MSNVPIFWNTELTELLNQNWNFYFLQIKGNWKMLINLKENRTSYLKAKVMDTYLNKSANFVLLSLVIKLSLSTHPLFCEKKFFFLLWRKGREKEKERGKAESFWWLRVARGSWITADLGRIFSLLLKITCPLWLAFSNPCFHGDHPCNFWDFPRRFSLHAARISYFS